MGLTGSPAAVRGDDREVPLSDWEAPEAGFVTNALPTNPLSFVGITPCRMADTRDLTFPPGYGPPALPAGSPRNFVLTGRCGIPSGALAVSANVTVVNPPGLGFLLIRPTDGPNVVVSTLNFIPGQTIANGAAVPLGTGGGATLLAGVTGTELIIDVNGYYVEGGGGVQTVNALTGDLTLAAGSNVSITPSGNTLTISATPSGGGGDITSVIAGPGLTGGGTTGDAALSVDTTTIQARVAGSCAAGSSIRVVNPNGTVTCETDDVGTYTVSPAGGLTLTGTQFAVANLGVTSGMLANSSVVSGKVAFNAVGLNEIAPDAVGASEIAANAVTTNEIADATIRRADISGTEVALYTPHADCGSSVLTLATTCSSELCQATPPILFRNCSGACVVAGPVQCSNTLRGYLLAPSIP
jgi:hypothetical protein